ncbi:AraC family transcriptional regulator [Sutcliffiella halmapala]|uniref:AraC family transcriptional regulator n=1 Tax=Sutcliffiella halmapala TaxID=79882 RepID=UPI0009955EFB|nr:AraC family transcriptional regulator [Sutcliffiella halmapala]
MKNIHISSSTLEEGEKCSIQQTLLYIAAGTGELFSTRNSVSRALKAGKSIWVEEATLLSTSKEFLKVYTIAFPSTINLTKTSLAYIDPNKMEHLVEELLFLQDNTTFSGQCRFQAKIWSFLATLTDIQEIDDIEETIQYLDQNITRNLTVSELATMARMTPTSFSRAFKKKTGLTPKEYVVEKRMKRAKELIIQHKGMTLKDIAYQLGIQDEFYFSRMFKKRVGVAPSIYVKRAKERVAIVSQIFLQDHLLALGVQPVAAPMYPSVFPASNGVPSYMEKELEGTLLLNAEKAFDPKEILQTKPDSIIKTFLHHGEEQSLSWENREDVYSLSLQRSWQDYLEDISSLVGKEEKVKQIKLEIQKLENEAKEKLCPITRLGGWAVIWVRPEEIRLYGYSDHACLDLLFQTLGFEPHPGLPKSGYRVITPMELAILNPDKLLILWSKKVDIGRLMNSATWSQLKAVQNKEVYIPDSTEWDPWGPLGRKYMIQNLVSFFQQSDKLA